MTDLAFTLVIFAIAILLIGLARRRQATPINDLRGLEQRMEPLDVEAFRVLVDPRERQYLRKHLPGSAFRQVQRERMRAAVDYVNVAIANAELITRTGEALQEHGSGEEVRQGRELLQAGLSLRIKAVFVRCKLYLCILVPDLSFSSAQLVSAYQAIESKLAAFCPHSTQAPLG